MPLYFWNDRDRPPPGPSYHQAYFARFPHVWHHGDFAFHHRTTDGFSMLGRSDGTLNPAGIRFGSAELYRVIEYHHHYCPDQQSREIPASTLATAPSMLSSVTSNYQEQKNDHHRRDATVVDTTIVGSPPSPSSSTQPRRLIEDCLAVGQKQGSDERVILFVKMVPGEVFTKEFESHLRRLIREHLSPRHVPAIILPVPDIPYTVNGKKVEVAVKRILAGEMIPASGAIANPQSLQHFYQLLPLLLDNTQAPPNTTTTTTSNVSPYPK
jgi:acyl-coenzyme A synthetase/AMP-(fatty) acid ligase